ncbi:hypothetical protein [Pseudoalteromonas umbrosa]|uniref:hypothetical protein n=1 Tax=Pseudoalteromonas umbrosa TaxID=3048489 RepID=UPI0024C40C03|nr:hypothetical protein [Pseudoalteromonas sp. B95]MDK1287416.1 hypothetical protein [Pseudoalteromonas sp. B95]
MKKGKVIEHIKEYHSDLYDELIRMFKDDWVICNWSTTSKLMLNNKSPIDLLDSEPEEVADFMLKLKKGDLS